MGMISVKRFSSPDEKRAFQDHGYVEILSFSDGTVGRGVFEPGWRWSKDVKPIANTKTCEASHAAFVVSGRMHIVSDEGDEADIGPGDVVFLEPGHDAWVIGNDPCILLDFGGMSQYAQPRGRTQPAQPSP